MQIIFQKLSRFGITLNLKIFVSLSTLFSNFELYMTMYNWILKFRWELKEQEET